MNDVAVLVRPRDLFVAKFHVFQMVTHSVNLARTATALHWSAPVHVLEVAETDAFNYGRTALLGCEFLPEANERSVESSLLELRSRIGHISIRQLIRSHKDRYSVRLSKRLDTRSAALAALIASLANRKARHQSVSGAFFAPFPVAVNAGTVADPNVLTSADLPLWNHLATIACKQRGRRIGWHPATVFSSIALSVIGLWTAGMLISGMSNGRSLSDARQTIQTLRSAPDPAARLQALLALQQQISHYEDRVAHQPPLWTRFGLNQDASILAALWPPYAAASKSILVTPIQQNLEATLVDLSQMPTESLDDQANAAAQEGHKALKTYLMLAEPSRVDSSFITPQLMRYWSTNANVSVGAKLDISERLAGFYAQHLKAHDASRIQPRPELVNASRRTLLSMIGVRNSEDTVYQSVLAGVGNKYPDQSLASLTAGTDTRGLIRTSVTVPGVYTRQAYEGYVASAITEAAKTPRHANSRKRSSRARAPNSPIPKPTRNSSPRASARSGPAWAMRSSCAPSRRLRRLCCNRRKRVLTMHGGNRSLLTGTSHSPVVIRSITPTTTHPFRSSHALSGRKED
jgi:type VI secretion system protein ImpL